MRQRRALVQQAAHRCRCRARVRTELSRYRFDVRGAELPRLRDERAQAPQCARRHGDDGSARLYVGRADTSESALLERARKGSW
jgi:hypothetical protein